jgi:putative FmdB family regulatory protein
MHKHRAAIDFAENLAGEACGCEARGDDCDCFHSPSFKGRSAGCKAEGTKRRIDRNHWRKIESIIETEIAGDRELPLYEYQCKKCHSLTERIQKFSDSPLTVCPHCGGELEQVLSAPAIQFKGSGWYVSDYAKKPSGGSSSKDNGSGGTSTSEGKSEAKSESKSETSSSENTSSKETSTSSKETSRSSPSKTSDKK